jgi:hypothetical protein
VNRKLALPPSGLDSPHFKEIPKDVNMRFAQFPLPCTIDILRDKILIVDWETSLES